MALLTKQLVYKNIESSNFCDRKTELCSDGGLKSLSPHLGMLIPHQATQIYNDISKILKPLIVVCIVFLWLPFVALF